MTSNEEIDPVLVNVAQLIQQNLRMKVKIDELLIDNTMREELLRTGRKLELSPEQREFIINSIESTTRDVLAKYGIEATEANMIRYGARAMNSLARVWVR